jgi:hypothetical protein
MTDIAYHFSAWAMTLAIGLPIFGLIAWKRWRLSQTSFLWRFILCVLLAGIFAPYVASEDFGGYTTVDVVPAAMLLLAFGFISQHDAYISGMADIFYILLASLVPLFIWTGILRIRKLRVDEAA